MNTVSQKILLRHTLSVTVFLAAISPMFAAARPWPDSSTTIVVFADQLPSGMTAAQQQFAATHLAGTQKQLLSQIQALRLYNPNFLCLHYQLAVGCGAAAFIIGDSWSSDWAYVNSQENWFLHNTATQRVHQSAWNWDVMDITYTAGVARTAFPQYWITSCVARIQAAADDGVFADSFTQDAYTFGQCSPTHPWFQDVGLCQSNWIPNLETFGSNIMIAFNADTNGYKFLPNLGGLITGWDPMNYGIGHGGMIEGFCFWDSASPFPMGDWQLQMSRALGLSRAGKILICQSYVDSADVQSRMFAVGSYLLIKGSRTYLNLLSSDVTLEYYPEYTLNLGAALQAPAADLDSLWNAGWGVYRRDYTNGIVLVNPSASVVNIASLGGTYRLATPVGGGAVDAGGSYGGGMSYSNITSLLLPAYSGAVLLQPIAPPVARGSGLPWLHLLLGQ
jgi:hypothetical protein